MNSQNAASAMVCFFTTDKHCGQRQLVKERSIWFISPDHSPSGRGVRRDLEAGTEAETYLGYFHDLEPPAQGGTTHSELGLPISTINK